MEREIEELIDIRYKLVALEEKWANREICQDALFDLTLIAQKINTLEENLRSCAEGENPWLG